MLEFNQDSAEQTLDKFDDATEDAIKKAIQAAILAKEVERGAIALQENGQAILASFNAKTEQYLPETVASKVTAASNFVGYYTGKMLPYFIDYSRRTVEASKAAVTLGINAQVAAEQARNYVAYLPQVKQIEDKKEVVKPN